jgi:hypothetical protein
MIRLKSYMRKILLYSTALLSIWIMLSQCMIMKERWSDKKAYRVFKTKEVPLQMHDTIINNSNLHYAMCGLDTFYPHSYLYTEAQVHGCIT